MSVPNDWNLTEVIRGRLGKHIGRQWTIFEEEHLLLLLHRVPEGGTTDRVGGYFWRQPTGTWLSSIGGANGLVALGQLLDEYDSAIDSLQAVQQEVEIAE